MGLPFCAGIKSAYVKFVSKMPLSPSTTRLKVPLTQQELCAISQAISRDFSPQFWGGRVGRARKIKFSSQELLEISQQISREFAPSAVSHQSRLVLLAVSPRRLHVYWQLAKQRLNAVSSTPQPSAPLTLRIYPEVETENPLTPAYPAPPTWFDIAVNADHGQQDIVLPEPVPGAGPIQYHAALGESHADHSFTPLSYSNTATGQASPAEQTNGRLPAALAQFITPLRTASSSVIGLTASAQGQ